MAVYLNPTHQVFERRLKSGHWVDKSPVLLELNGRINDEDLKYICISRPRRFGKTVTAEMLGAYYDKEANSAWLFDPLQVAILGSQIKEREQDTEDTYHKHLNRYEVIFISMATEYSSAGNCVAKLKER